MYTGTIQVHKQSKNRQGSVTADSSTHQAVVAVVIVFIWLDSPPVGQGLLIHEVSISHTTTSLDGWSGRRRDLTTHNTHNRQPSMPQVGFEPIISAGERPQTYALDRAATMTSSNNNNNNNNNNNSK